MTAAAVAAPPTASKPRKLAAASQSLPHSHMDYVLDVAFDHYGRRFATASADRTVRVWDLSPDGLWTGRALGGGGAANEWQAHRGPVHRVGWAHPEFGQLLATAGADHAVVVWEEREGGFQSLASPERGADGFLDARAGAAGGGETAEGTAASRWINKATLSDARRAVTCVEFAPRHLGLRLAAGSADGAVRVYEALDAMNLNHWKLEAEIEDGAGGGGGGPRAVEGASSGENVGCAALSWCTGRFEPATLAIGYSSGRASIYRYDDAARSYLEAIRLPGHAAGAGVPRGVLDVSWAPNVGRSYHLIATCGKDDRLKVHRVKRGRGNGAEGGSSSLTYEGTEVLESQSWRCRWNVTGTVLASSGDGGTVKLWKSGWTAEGFKCVSEIVG